MQPSERDVAYLWDMLEAAREALEFTQGLVYEQFRLDRLRQSAVERKIEIIGEAARRLSESFKATHPEVAWQRIIGQRNVLAHEYDSIRQEAMWLVLTQGLPPLIAALEALDLTPPPDPEPRT
jgi:uncharacterized protein with HEPN domain